MVAPLAVSETLEPEHKVEDGGFTVTTKGGIKATVNVTGVPAPQAFVSVTVIVPAVAPKVTVIELVPCPAVILAPAGTDQLYVEPAVGITE